MDRINRRSVLASFAALVWVPFGRLFGQQTRAAEQFVYVLRVAPRYHDRSAWTATENAALGKHFERLTNATKAGRVILAGRTSEPLDQTFGLVIFEADSPGAAQAFAETDPAVVAGVMTVTVHPYAVALMRK